MAKLNRKVVTDVAARLLRNTRKITADVLNGTSKGLQVGASLLDGTKKINIKVEDKK